MPDETSTVPTDHVNDSDLVYIMSNVEGSEAVGSCLGKAFKEVWAPKGYTQATREQYEAHQAVLAQENAGFIANPEATMPPEGVSAQDIFHGVSPSAAGRPYDDNGDLTSTDTADEFGVDEGGLA